jgi:hypothetical protein
MRLRHEAHRDFLSCVVGVAFLGTPHQGSAFTMWAEAKLSWSWMTGWITGVTTNAELISILSVNSPTLSYLQQEFEEICADERLANLMLFCYFELDEVPLPPHIVVDRDSACLQNAASRGMKANHMEMNKFKEGSDPNYKELLGDLRNMFTESRNMISTRFASWRYGEVLQDFGRERMQRWLDPSTTPQTEQLTRKLNAHKMAPYTCQWLLKVENFQGWLNSSPSLPNLLWVKGKAGSGKSVLAAYAIDYLRQHLGGSVHVPCEVDLRAEKCGYKSGLTTVLYYFCGVDRARDSPEKMIGTLIHLLLLIHCDDEELFQMAMKEYEGPQGRMGENLGWQQLASLLLRMIAVVGKV